VHVRIADFLHLPAQGKFIEADAAMGFSGSPGKSGEALCEFSA
jgi:hypothetical protein